MEGFNSGVIVADGRGVMDDNGLKTVAGDCDIKQDADGYYQNNQKAYYFGQLGQRILSMELSSCRATFIVGLYSLINS